MIRIPVRCAARFNGDQWEAICLNFDIAVQGASLNDVKESLDKSIKMYLESFSGERFTSAKDLLNAISRPAPWRVSMPIHFSVMLHSLVSMFGGRPEDRLSYYNDVNDFCPA